MVRFVEEEAVEPTWAIKKPNFGRYIPNLFLDMIEIKRKLKPNAPLIPDSTYQGDAFTEPENFPPPEGGPQPEVHEEEHINLVVEEELESQSHAQFDGTQSDDGPDYTAEEMEVLDRFAETPPHRMDTPEAVSMEDVPSERYIPTEIPMTTEEPEPEEDEEDRYARELVEKRVLISYLKKHNIEFSDTDSLKILRALKGAQEQEDKKSQCLTVNRMLLGFGMWMSSEGMEWMDPELQGYLQYQMKLMPMYDSVLQEFEDMEIAQIITDLPPSAKLASGVAISSGLFVAMKKYNIEEKLKNSKFLETLIPGYGQAIDNMTRASREVKEERGETAEDEAPKRRRRRGPSVKASEIPKM